jgi:chemotaxis protein methyltransferase CheR
MSLAPTTDAYRQWTPSILGYLRDLVQAETSIDVGVDRLSLWHSRLGPILRAGEMADAAELVTRLRQGDARLRHQVVDAMTTHETLFFRDGAAFEGVLRGIIPEMVEQLGGTRPLTIWSAASSSGQEIYSVAMFLDRYFPELLTPDRLQLLASDVSHGMVERVKEARFTPLEVRRGLPHDYRDQYLRFDGGRWEVVPHLRGLVRTRVINLMRPLTMLPRCDIVLLRNVLIYFDDADRQSLLGRIGCEVMARHGALLLGASEILNSRTEHFVSERVGAGLCYRPIGSPDRRA